MGQIVKLLLWPQFLFCVDEILFNCLGAEMEDQIHLGLNPIVLSLFAPIFPHNTFLMGKS